MAATTASHIIYRVPVDAEHILKRLFMALSVVFVCFLSVLTQQTRLFAQSPNESNSQSLELKVSTLEQNYDTQIYLLLSNYFDRKRFFVDVNINAEFVDETVETTSNQVRPTQRNVTMPGLPFLPQENIRPQQLPDVSETVVNQSTVRSLRLININISLYADTSYSNEEVQFMRLLTGIASKINESRGDVINVTQIPIPDFTDNDPIQVVNAEPEEPESLLASFKEYIPVFILMLLFGGIMLLNNFFNKPKEGELTPLQQRETIKHDFNFSGSPGQVQGVILDKAGDRDFSLEVDDAVDAFFKKPKEIALLFEFWIDEDGEEGVLKCAEVLKSIDSHLLRTLKNDLQEENYEAIQKQSEELDPVGSSRKDRLVREFNSLLKEDGTGSYGAKKKGHITLFKFLEHISDSVLLKLLKEEGYQTGALILDYLPEERAAKAIDRLDRTRSTNIMLRMAAVDDIPYKLQSEISAKLFEKAMDLKEVEKEQRYGAENILSVLDKLPLNEQQDYIDQLKTTNSIVGEIVQRQFVTINQLLTITDDIIKQALKDMDTSTLLDAVTGLEPKIVDKILSVRPNREQKLIRLELEEIDNASEKDTNYAKSQMMGSIRKTLHAHNEEQE